MFEKIKVVKPLADFWLYLEFENGEKKRYDVKPFIAKYEPFKPLATTEGLFEQVYVDTGGYAVIFNDKIDLSCNDLYIDGVDISDVA
jgi:hypothetical protein